jgi:hypothetical protein
MWCDVMWCDVMRGAIWYDFLRYNMILIISCSGNSFPSSISPLQFCLLLSLLFLDVLLSPLSFPPSLLPSLSFSLSSECHFISRRYAVMRAKQDTYIRTMTCTCLTYQRCVLERRKEINLSNQDKSHDFKHLNLLWALLGGEYLWSFVLSPVTLTANVSCSKRLDLSFVCSGSYG